MKKYWFIGGSLTVLAGAAFIAARLAYAGVTCTLPFNLQNNTVADANQVMANYNALVTCLTQAAHAGSNSDITALNALATPIPPSSGGTSYFIGSVSTGTNALTTTTTPSGFSLTAGYRVGFIAGATNTAEATIDVNATGVTNIVRPTAQGIHATQGGEIIIGQYVELLYTGSVFQLTSNGIQTIGEIKDWAATAGASPPAGWFFADGSCQDRTTYSTLFGIIGTTFNQSGTPCTGTQFQLPDLRGRTTYGKDDQGGSAANRVTSAITGCTGTTLGANGCGSQNATVAHTNLPQIPITDPGHIHNLVSGAPISSAGVGSVAVTGASFAASTIASNTTGITVNATSTNVPLPVLNPMQVVYKIIKY